MLFTLRELFDVIVMTAAVGFIFMDLFRRYQTGFDKNAFLFACMVTSPAIIFHELAHKLVAVSFGLQATFQAAYFWLILGVVLKLIRFNFIFFVPGYVSIAATQTAQLTPLSHALIAGAGPFLNLVLFLGSWALLQKKRLKKNTYVLLQVTKQINLLLFVLNMLPIPFFDGLKVYQGLFQAFF